MSVVVLDASVALSWIIPEQATGAARRVLRSDRITGFEAPHLFPYEVRNALLKLERRGLSGEEMTSSGLADLAAMPIAVQPSLLELERGRVMALARGERLSFYDACYLDLCLRRHRTLASRDAPLLNAATRHGVDTIDARAD